MLGSPKSSRMSTLLVQTLIRTVKWCPSATQQKSWSIEFTHGNGWLRKERRTMDWKLICPWTLRSFYKRLGTESKTSLRKNSHMITKRNNFISAWKPYPCANKSALWKSSAHCRGKVDYFVKQRPFQIKKACWVAIWIVVWPPQLLKT